MSTRHFLHCRDCKEVFRPSPYDRRPEFTVTRDGVLESRRDDCMAFLVRHARHALRTLRPTALSAHSGPLSDPLTVTYWQITDGDELALVRGWRERLGEPRRYCVVPGRLVREPATVEIPEDEIRAEIDRALYPGVAAPRRLTAFVARFRSIVAGLDPATLEPVYEVPTDPTLHVARLPVPALAKLLDGLDRIFDRADARLVSERVRTRADELDAFTVLVRQPVRVELQ